MTQLTRRDFIAALSSAGVAPTAFAHGRHGAPGASAGFLHGVASGDPLHDRVILWTRVTAKGWADEVQGRWSVATDPRMKRICGTGRFETDITRDFTVKVDAGGLDPGRTYYYRFETRGMSSPTGRTRVWDDHEITNDAYRDGAENHNPEQGEGEWTVRRRHAVRAYNEYMPIRSRTVLDDKVYRHFRVGDLADLILLDTHLHSRDKQAAFKSGQSDLPATDPIVSDPQRTLLGFDQERWLEQQLLNSKRRGARWRIFGQQVMLAQLSATLGQTIINPDQWDGYAPARQRLFRNFAENDIANNIVLTGDIHSSWCNDLCQNPWDPSSYNPASGAGVLGVEFVTPAVTSPGPYPDPATAAAIAAQLRFVSPRMKYIDLSQRGYSVLQLTQQRASCEIYHVGSVAVRSTEQRLAATFVSESGNNVLQAGATGPTPQALADPAPATE